MAMLREGAPPVPSTRALSTSVDLETPPETAFDLLCAVEKWPVWLAFVRSAERVSGAPLAAGSEILIRSAIPGQPEQLFEVDHFIANYHLSLVGAYSVRRRIDFRLERKTKRCKLQARLQYPAYGGRFGVLCDQFRAARKLGTLLDASLMHFKHLAEYDSRAQTLLEDF